LREEIVEGRLQPGEQIPPEEELATQYGVSRMTLRRAVTDLIDAGLIYRRHGVGTFVSYRRIRRDHTRLTDFFESAEMQGLEAGARLLKRTSIPADEHVAQALSLKEGEPVLHVQSVRYIDDQPVTIHNSYVPQERYPELAEVTDEEILSCGSSWALLERRGHTIVNALQRVEASEANPAQAELLDVSPGSPILCKERVIFTEDGTPLDLEVCWSRGDKYSVTVMLKR
jgi:GntR family transcriptional regulator